MAARVFSKAKPSPNVAISRKVGVSDSSSNSSTNHPLVLFGLLDLSRMPRHVQFVVLAFGVFATFVRYGVIQERLTTEWKRENLQLTWFLTLVQCTFYAVVPFVSTYLWGALEALRTSGTPGLPPNTSRPKPKLIDFIRIGALSLATIGLSNAALENLSYPTQVAFKSAKPIPVQIVGIFVLKKVVKPSELFATICLTLGLVLFSLADYAHTSDTKFSLVGIVAVSMALIADGLIGNLQQKLFASSQVTPSEMMMKTKIVAAALAFVLCLGNGQLETAITHLPAHPESILSMLEYSLIGMVGETFVMGLIQQFGALAAVITTSVRKCLSVMLSFVLFARPLTKEYALASLLVTLGVAAHIALDNRRSAREAMERKRTEEENELSREIEV